MSHLVNVEFCEQQVGLLEILSVVSAQLHLGHAFQEVPRLVLRGGMGRGLCRSVKWGERKEKIVLLIIFVDNDLCSTRKRCEMQYNEGQKLR